MLVVAHKDQAIKRGIAYQRNVIGDTIERNDMANLRFGNAMSERRVGEPHRIPLSV